MGTQRKPTSFARTQRRDQPEAERALWHVLRSRQLEGVKFRRQQPLGPYILDFVSFERNIVVEVDGGQHNQARRRTSDNERTKWLEGEGFTVLRFWNNDVPGNLEGVLDNIRTALA